MDNIENIRKERMRYTTNKLSGNLALLAVVIDVAYFICIYKVNNLFMYNPLIGVSVICNLLFMLITILSSQGVKAYNFKFSVTLIVVGVVQIVRIFILPLRCLNAETEVITSGQFALWVSLLAASAVALFASGIFGCIKSKQFHNYMNTLQLKAA